MVLNEVESRNVTQLAITACLRSASIASGWPETDSEGKMEAVRRAQSHFNLAGKELMPYVAWEEHDIRKAEVDELRKEYVKQFGDPSDPKFQEEMAKLQAHLQGQLTAAKARSAAEAKQAEEWQNERTRKLAARRQRVGDRRAKWLTGTI